jgi:ABC-type sugar transport system ATPase subunit
MFLEVKNISKKFKNQQVLKEICFNVDAHQTLSILGKSGCGKSTLLKIIAGIETVDGGKVNLQNQNVLSLPAQKRKIVYLFQEALLFPNMNVFENIAFGLKIRNIKKHIINTKVKDMLLQLELDGYDKKMPHELSGGQKQRVAFGRALILNPPLILLDEPFSSLDVETRSNMQQLYKKIAKEYQITALFVTHDLKEALLMGDKICFMENGVLEVYEDKQSFIRSEKTGVQNEINFWNNL